MISIDTKRLHLRNVLQNDVDVIFDYRNNEICARYQRGQVKDYEGIVSLIERRRNDEISIDFPCMIAVALKDTNEMIGEIVVMPKDHTFSLGYTFSYKYHRQGYAFEALTVLTEHLHKMAPEWEFISFTECENIASIELLKKLGYKNLGYVPSLDSQAFGKRIGYLSALHESLHQFTDNVFRVGTASAVTGNQQLTALFIAGFQQFIRFPHIIFYRIKYRIPLHQFL